MAQLKFPRSEKGQGSKRRRVYEGVEVPCEHNEQKTRRATRDAVGAHARARPDRKPARKNDREERTESSGNQHLSSQASRPVGQSANQASRESTGAEVASSSGSQCSTSVHDERSWLELSPLHTARSVRSAAFNVERYTRVEINTMTPWCRDNRTSGTNRNPVGHRGTR